MKRVLFPALFVGLALVFALGCSATGVSEASRSYDTEFVRGAGGNDSSLTVMHMPNSTEVYSLTGDAQQKPAEYKMQVHQAGGNGGPINIYYAPVR
jgi:hypothetical protein